MESLSMQLQPFFEWLLRTTLQASLLICLIFLFQAVLRNKLGARWHYCLWLLLLIRMAMPWAPQSRVSVFNLIPQSLPQRQTEYARQEVGDDAVSSDAASPSTAESTTVSTTEVVQDTSKAITVAPEIGKESQGRLKPVVSEVANILPLVWLTGALALAVYVCASNFNLLRIVKRERPLTDQKILDLLEDCKAEMGIRIILGVVATDKVKSPALFGFIRPRLLLPAGMLEALSPKELRHVFLHELAHLKRHDIYIGWLMSLLQVLHWFNPLIWLAFYRLRADRELACDALVLARLSSGGLARTQSSESKDYGRTIVSLLERFSCPQRLPGMAGILETKAQLKRRIKMIARFKKDSYRWSPLAMVFIIVLACVALPDAIQEKTFAKPGRHITLRQIWAGDESPWQGKISPDGRYFSFVDWGENSGNLAILELATGKTQRLTNKGDESEKYEYAFFSRWSPDGKQIVYEYEGGDFVELHIIGLDGSKPRILYRDEKGGYVRPHDWSPDGKQVLAFLGREGTNQIVLISVTDGSMRVIKTITHGEHPYHWSFSPDGRYIVYDSPQAEDSPEPDIFLFSIDEKREVPIVEHPAKDFLLGWAPDSDWFLFVSDRTGSWDAWAISVAEGKPKGNPELIKKGIGNIYPMGFTQNGAFYYTDSKQMEDIYTVTMNPETGKIDSPPNKLPILGLGGNDSPQYSPDGKYLAYIRHRNVLCILSLETSKVRKFPLKFQARYPSWSPDRQYILIHSIDVKRRSGIYRLEVKTGNIIPISLPKKEYNIDSEYGTYLNEWSHDGKSFFYVEFNRKNKLRKILNRDFETGNEKELYQGPKLFSISLSPDGQWLAFTSRKQEGSIKIMPASGGEPRELCKRVQQGNSLTPLAWTADGRYVLFCTRQTDSLKSNLWRVPIEGGKPQKLGLEMAGINSLTVHPNGRQITFSSVGPSSKESEVWVMENFLPTGVSQAK